MGCGSSSSMEVMAQDDLDTAPHKAELSSVTSSSPDHKSGPVRGSASPDPVSRPVINGGQLPPQPPNTTDAGGMLLGARTEDGRSSNVLESSSLRSAGGQPVAFEVNTNQGDSLIKRHPPRRFQRLEDQQQQEPLTQEDLEQKQATAEKRRQEILSARVQSAKQRTARSAGRMRSNIGDDVETFMRNEELDFISLVKTTCYLPPIPGPQTPAVLPTATPPSNDHEGRIQRDAAASSGPESPANQNG